MHEVLVNSLGGLSLPRKSVVSLTDRPDMTVDITVDVKQQQHNNKYIPKGNKDKHYLKNWRPISLLNTIYKLASACIAERLKILPCLIDEDQTGLISGRYIGENNHYLHNVIKWKKIITQVCSS